MKMKKETQILDDEQFKEYKEWCSKLTSDEEYKIADWKNKKEGRSYSLYYLEQVLQIRENVTLEDFESKEYTEEVKGEFIVEEVKSKPIITTKPVTLKNKFSRYNF